MKTETLFIYFKTSCCSHPVKLTQVQNGAKTPRTVTCNDKSIKPKNYVKNPFATTNIVLKKVSGKWFWPYSKVTACWQITIRSQVVIYNIKTVPQKIGGCQEQCSHLADVGFISGPGLYCPDWYFRSFPQTPENITGTSIVKPTRWTDVSSLFYFGITVHVQLCQNKINLRHRCIWLVLL